MRGALVCAIALLMLCPTAVAPPPQQAQGGLSNACQNSQSQQPCLLAGVIPTTTIEAGDAAVYQDGEWTVDGTITVESGGSLLLDNAIFQFTDQSGGILVQAGGTLTIVGSLLEPHGNDLSPFVVDAAEGSVFTLNTTTIFRGNGVRVATSAVDMSGNSLEEIELALFLHNVTATIHHNQFLNNTVAVNQTGGVPTLDHNRFDGGEICVRNWMADPTISNNVFRGCHIGILHERSDSTFLSNDMEDAAEPPGVGILVSDTHSPVIQGNTISRYGTGILVRNATAYIRDNVITQNVGDGIRVEANTQPMDIQNNSISLNGGDGIDLRDATDVLVRNNTVFSNGAYGIVTLGATGLLLDDNHAHTNGVDGIALVGSPAATVSNNVVQENGATGIVVGVGSPDAEVTANLASGNGQHGVFVRSDDANLSLGESNGNGLSGWAFENVSGIGLLNVQAHGNGLHGFRFTYASATGADVIAIGNAGSGMVVAGVGELVIDDANASENGLHGFDVDLFGTLSLFRASAMANVHDGLHHVRGSTTANEAWWQDNGGEGVENLDDATVVTECSYWGSSTGPTHPDNQGGTGDEVVGNVDYFPYRTHPAHTSCAPQLS